MKQTKQIGKLRNKKGKKMDIILQEKDDINELVYRGKPVLKQKHRVFEIDGQLIVQVGDMNKLAADAVKDQVSCLQ